MKNTFLRDFSIVVIVVILCSRLPAIAQDAPAPKEPTIAELKQQIAEKNVELAQMKLQLIQAQAQLAYRHALDELAAAKKAVEDIAPKPEMKK